MAGKFAISQRSNGDFQFNLQAANGQVVLTSEGYSSKSACEVGIESVRMNSQIEGRFQRETASNGQYYFNLAAGNGQVIGTSERYGDPGSRDNGIDSVRRHANQAAVDDRTA